jgi:hypothetical protein
VKAPSATHLRQISDCFESLVLARSELFPPESTTLPVEDIGELLLVSSFPVVSSSCPCLFWFKTEVHALIF